RQAVLGSNPIAFAAPAEPVPFWFDAATTVVPKGKLEVYRKADKPLCDGWAVDETGEVSADASHVLHCIDGKVGAGGILPVGGAAEESGSHKGYGYSMICELLCAITSGGATSNHHVREAGKGAGTCHAFIVIDPAIFGDAAAQKAHLSAFLEELRGAARADAAVPILTHGEKERASMAWCLREGIEVDISTVAEMMAICRALGMDSRDYLGDVDVAGAKESVY
ncbi:MAG: Ldh family oxidoreductase, partial [Clostridia bacterium]|nr:Ldh family oxidoreductase [Clostridia bacterium]